MKYKMSDLSYPEYKIRRYRPSDYKPMIRFLFNQKLNYPDYMLWVLQAIDELVLNRKLAFVATLDRKIVGAIVFQKHRQINWLLEIKNVYVLEEHRRLGLGKILFMMAESVARTNNLSAMVYDIPEKANDPLDDFVYRKCGFNFHPIRLPLYDLSVTDTVLVKFICSGFLGDLQKELEVVYQKKHDELVLAQEIKNTIK